MTLTEGGGKMQPKVKLISWTRDPIETVEILWEASRTKGHVKTVEELKDWMGLDNVKRDMVKKNFVKILQSAIPIAENISFTFLLENVSISFREQMVRHRVGVKVGERVGMDYIPDLHDSTWWSQSMRVLDMGTFADDKAYRVPESVESSMRSHRLFVAGMAASQEIYKSLIALGIPAEDAREILPLGTQHRISWTLNLATLAHIISKRSCWILQLGLWGPIIEGILNEICEKVDPIFRMLAIPPCMKGDTFNGCKFELDNEKRLAGEDPLPPCALWVGKTRPEEGSINDVDSRTDYKAMCAKYSKFWRRNVQTGETIR